MKYLTDCFFGKLGETTVGLEVLRGLGGLGGLGGLVDLVDLDGFNNFGLDFGFSFFFGDEGTIDGSGGS